MAAPRSVASLTIAFGMISVPVRIYTATQAGEKAVSFNLLSPRGERLTQQYVDPNGNVVERADMLRGFEYEKGKYVTFTPDEIKGMEEAKSDVLEIAEFVPSSALDPVFYEKAYFVAPDKGGARAYSLLAEAMRATKQTAIGRYAARGKEHVVQLRAVPGGIVMQHLLYADEVRSIEDLGVEQTDVKAQELELAKMLIGQIAADAFDPSAFTDAVAARIHAAVEAKMDGKPIAVSAPVKAAAPALDMMAALQASLAVAAPKGKVAKGKEAVKITTGKKRAA